MVLPKRITIKGKEWTIKRPRKLVERGNECYGLCDYDARIISVLRNLEDAMCAQTFAHEIIHATLHELHIELDKVLDEAIAEGVSLILSEVFMLLPK